MPHHRRPVHRRTAVMIACALSSSALVSIAGATPASAKTRFPRSVHAANGDIRIASKPKRIVSLSPTATEMLFAIGAGSQVVAVDDQSNYPAVAPKTALSGFQPNLEAIAGYKPDLVVIANDPKELVAGLNKLSIPVLLLPAAATLADSYTQLAALGTASDHRVGASRVVAHMKTSIASLASKAKGSAPLTYFHELDDTLYSVTSKTFIGSVYALVGLNSIADAADKDGGGYPQLNAEYVIAQNPDLILLADTKCCKQSATSIAARPGWASMRAVKNGAVVQLDDDVASRWGPRIVDLLRAVVSARSKAGAKAAA